MTPGFEVRTWPDAERMATAMAEALVERLAQSQGEGNEPHVALTGGTIAVTLHRHVARSAARDSVRWDRVHFWFGDERFLPREHPERNARQAWDAMLAHLPVDPARVHEAPASDGDLGGDLDAAAAAYAQELRAHGAAQFDVVILGVGPDGHVASLFPGFPQLDVEETGAVAVRDSPKPPPERVSLTFPALERARDVWFVVAGEQKAEAVRRATDAATDFHDVPAARPRGRERTVWFLDDAAASLL